MKQITAEDGLKWMLEWTCQHCGFEPDPDWEVDRIFAFAHVGGLLYAIKVVCPDCGVEDELESLVRANPPD